jgi:hypothetical protein
MNFRMDGVCLYGVELDSVTGCAARQRAYRRVHGRDHSRKHDHRAADQFAMEYLLLPARNRPAIGDRDPRLTDRRGVRIFQIFPAVSRRQQIQPRQIARNADRTVYGFGYKAVVK